MLQDWGLVLSMQHPAGKGLPLGLAGKGPGEQGSGGVGLGESLCHARGWGPGGCGRGELLFWGVPTHWAKP